MPKKATWWDSSKSWADVTDDTATTREPADEAAGDSDGSLVTESTGTAKTSKCLSNKQRSKRWQEKRLAKHLEHIKTQKEKAGKEFTELQTQEEYREAQRQQMLRGSGGLSAGSLRRFQEEQRRCCPSLGSVAEDDDGPDAAAGSTTARVIQDVFKELEQQQLPSEVLVDEYIQSTKAFWEAPFIHPKGTKPDPGWIDFEEARVIITLNGNRWCTLCQKHADLGGGHTSSKMHMARLWEMSSFSVMFGPCDSLRRFEPELHGLPGRCNGYAFRRFWGSQIDYQFKCLVCPRLFRLMFFCIRQAWRGAMRQSRSGVGNHPSEIRDFVARPPTHVARHEQPPVNYPPSPSIGVSRVRGVRSKVLRC